MTSYLIIGNGAAGTAAAEQIRHHDAHGDITMVTAESLPLYSRIRLPEFIAGGINEDRLILKDTRWHEDRAIDLKVETTVSRVDYDRRVVLTVDGKSLPYDRLLLATGSNAFVPPVQGSDKKGVFTLRTVADARRLRALGPGVRDMVLVGGGLLGLEAASALVRTGKRVTVVEFFDRLLPRQLDVEGGRRLRALLEQMGFDFRLGAVTEKITGDDTVEGVCLKSGETLVNQGVLFSAGVRSELSLVGSSGMETDRGIVVSDTMESTVPGVYAAGDVAQFDNVNFCIWPEAAEQGRVAGINMAGGQALYKNKPPSNILKVAGITLASAGDIDVDGKYAAEVTADDTRYQKIVRDDAGRIIGCIMLGDASEFNSILKKIKGEQ